MLQEGSEKFVYACICVCRVALSPPSCSKRTAERRYMNTLRIALRLSLESNPCPKLQSIIVLLLSVFRVSSADNDPVLSETLASYSSSYYPRWGYCFFLSSFPFVRPSFRSIPVILSLVSSSIRIFRSWFFDTWHQGFWVVHIVCLFSAAGWHFSGILWRTHHNQYSGLYSQQQPRLQSKWPPCRSGLYKSRIPCKVSDQL